MTKILFGANGGLGSELSHRLEPDYALDRSDVDIEDAAQVEAFFGQRWDGPLQVVNATGKLHNGSLRKLSDECARDMINSTIVGAFNLLKHFRINAPEGSSIVMLSSVIGTRSGVAGAAVYGACKAAVEGLVMSAAKEFGPSGLSVSCIRLGYFDAGMIDRVPPARQRDLLQQIPVRRWGSVDELSETITYVLSCPYLNGGVLELSGGVV